VLLTGALALAALPSTDAQDRMGGRGKGAQWNPAVPAKAVKVYVYVIEHGRAPRGYVGGREFQNRERRLPKSERYREYDVNPKVRGQNRGPERLVIDQRSRAGWYTQDHYRTFLPLKR
jgi:guanyl-specific ribonuclease Sa